MRSVQIIVEVEDDSDLLTKITLAAKAAIDKARSTFAPEILAHVGAGGCFFRPAHDAENGTHALVHIGPAK